MRVYLDSSVYLALLLGEPAAEPLRKVIEGADRCSSSLLVLEARRNLVRLARERKLAPAELQEAVDKLVLDQDKLELKDLTLDLCADPFVPVLSTPRSLDLAHLQTALWFQREGGLQRFLSLDGSQIQAARELGLPV